MGNLHAGHIALIARARDLADKVVASVFVNPLQFAPHEDFDAYPRTLDADAAKLTLAGCDLLFAPSVDEMYPNGRDLHTQVSVPGLSEILDGAHRPGHFTGVATVVCKLFNVVRPHVALFGEKDYQQLAVIRRMVADLDMAIEILGMPIVREPDGLAMSSRNVYLAPPERARARSLSRALFAARDLAQAGERDAARRVAAARAVVEPEADRIDYLELRDAETLAPLAALDRPGVLLVAAFVGATRLIDNVGIAPVTS